MLKKIAFSGLGIALLASPLLASADMVSDLQAQIEALIAQIKTLQAQTNASTPSGNQFPSNATNCANLTTNMGPDDTDVDTNGNVTRLQQFLGGRVTGYFGPMTLGLVQRWQASHGLVSSGDPESTGFGYVGPRTRAAMAQGCGNTAAQTTYSDGTTGVGSGPVCDAEALRTACPAGQHYESAGPDTIDSNGCRHDNLKCVPDSSSTATFSASPTSGQAPLTVTFTSKMPPGGNRVDFGDGTSGDIVNWNITKMLCPAGVSCNSGTGSISHTYQQAGTYIAKLKRAIGETQSYPSNPIYETIGTVTITVGGNTAGGPRLAPQGAAAGVIGAPVTIIGTGFTPGNTNNVFFGNPSVPGGPALAAANLAPTNSGSKGYQQLFFTIPAYIAVGTYPVSVSNANGSSGTNDANGSPVTYKVTTSPSISSVSPSPASVGSTITISGKGFDQELVNVDIWSTTGQKMQVTGATPTAGGTQVSIPLLTNMVPAGQYLVSVRNLGVGTPFGGIASKAVPLTVTGGTPVTPTFSASPTSGQAPLTVVFTSDVKMDSTSGYPVLFGDGARGYGGNGGWAHTYSAPGTYTATLLQTFSCTAGPETACDPRPAQTLGTATITVSTQSTPSITVTSVVGPLDADRHFVVNATFSNIPPSTVDLVKNDGLGTDAQTFMPIDSVRGWDAFFVRGTVPAGSYFLRVHENSTGRVVVESAPFNLADTQPQPTVNEQCTGYTFTQNLARGSVGYEVYQVRKFLNILNLGYEGEGSRYDDNIFRAVDAFQRKYSLSVGEVGVWDAMTRARANAINAQCQPAAPILTANPTTGTAPLYVSFKTNIADATINFGDGTTGTVSPNCISSFDMTNCNTGSYLASHTYATAGTYTATLTMVGACATGSCAQTAGATITVTGLTVAAPTCTLSGAPGNEMVSGIGGFNLNWTTVNASTANLTGGAMNLNSGVPVTGNPYGQPTQIWVSQPGTYTLTVMGTYGLTPGGGLVTGSCSTTVGPQTCGDRGCSTTVDPSTYPTNTKGEMGASAGSNANLASALTALESILQALIAKLGQ